MIGSDDDWGNDMRRPPPDHDAKDIIAVAWWLDRDHGTALVYSVDELGRAYSARNAPRAIQDSYWRQLTAKQLACVKELASTLQPSAAKPPADREVSVSFERDGKWRTETYDASKLPDSFERIITLLGERGETRDRHKVKTK